MPATVANPFALSGGRWSWGERNISLDNIERIAETLGLTAG